MWKNKFGFTMTELLVVMGIMGVLGTILATTLVTPNIKKANDAKRVTDLQSVYAALEQYYNSHNFYPSTGNLNALVADKLLESVPTEAVSGRIYYYVGTSCTSGSNCKQFKLCGYLENSNPGSCPGNPSCGSLNCNYGITPP